MKTINKKFDSLTAFSAWLNATAPAGYFADSDFLASTAASEDFTGTSSFYDADRLLLGGWHDGAARVSAYIAGGARGHEDRPQSYYSPVGFAPSVGRYLSGHPYNMINRRRVSVPAPVVSIVYNAAVHDNKNTTPAAIEKAAAKLFNVIAGLEQSGVRVELWVGVFAKTYEREAVNIAVKIKSAGQPFNLLKMIYPIVHPSFLRRHGFAAIERVGVPGSGWKYYGAPIITEKETEQAAAACGLRGTCFSYYTIKNLSEKEIKEMIK